MGAQRLRELNPSGARRRGRQTAVGPKSGERSGDEGHPVAPRETGVIGAGGNPAFAALSGLLLGTRNTLYGLKVAPMLGYRGRTRVVAAHLVIDESTAMTVTRTSREHARAGFLSTGLSVFVLWNLATLVGALAGNALGDPRTYGLDAAVGGAFLGLLWPRLDSLRTRLAALLAAALALTLVPITPSGVPVLAAAVVAVGIALVPPASGGTTADEGAER